MNHYITADTIRKLREGKNFTQKQLAELLSVSDKTISKWETGRGLPDISLLEPLSAALGVSVAELLSGACITNINRSGNLLRSCFYVCPVCQNVLFSTGEGSFSCCGITLPLLEAEAAEDTDTAHEIHYTRVENEWFVTLDHPMTKTHYISFIALITTERIQLVRLYPEQNAEVRFPIRGHGKLLAYCNRHGLYAVNLR